MPYPHEEGIVLDHGEPVGFSGRCKHCGAETDSAPKYCSVRLQQALFRSESKVQALQDRINCLERYALKGRDHHDRGDDPLFQKVKVLALHAQYSFADIEYDWELLTDEEKAFLSPLMMESLK